MIAVVRGSGAGRRGREFAAIESSLDGTRVDVGPLSVAAIHQLFRRALGSLVPAPSAGRHTSGGRRQPVLRARNRQGNSAGRHPATGPAAAGSRGPPGPGAAPLAQAPASNPRRSGRTGRHAQCCRRPGRSGSTHGRRAGRYRRGPARRAGGVRPPAVRVSAVCVAAGGRTQEAAQAAGRARPPDPVERARHLALAASGPDEVTSAELRACRGDGRRAWRGGRGGRVAGTGLQADSRDGAAGAGTAGASTCPSAATSPATRTGRSASLSACWRPCRPVMTGRKSC